MTKSAAILFVRNEVDTISWWIAHHATIGFSTLIICDDHSTDGTWTVLSNAASFYDIRLQRSDSTISDQLERQSAFHKIALDQGSSEFDWMMVLAADEYLHFENAGSVTAFVAGNTAPAIPVNWCLFGSAGQQSPSPFSPVETFTHHGVLNLPDHHVVRHLVQPRLSGDSLPDPFSALNQEPNWATARILHFAAGDRESFFKKQAGTDPEAAWENFDRNDADYTAASRWLPESRRIAASITQATLTDLYWLLKGAVTHADRAILQKLGLDPSLLSAGPAENREPQLRFCMLGQTKRLVMDSQTGSFVSVAPDDMNAARHNPVLMALEISKADFWNACLFTERPLSSPYLPLQGSPTLLPMVPLSVLIPENGIVSPVSGEAVHIPGTEHTLTEVEATMDLYSRMTSFMVLTAEGHSLPALIRGIDRLPSPDSTALGCAIAMLPYNDARRLADAFPGLVPLNVMPARQPSA